MNIGPANHLVTLNQFQAMPPAQQRAHLRNQITAIESQLGQLHNRIMANVGENQYPNVLQQ